MTTRGKRAVPIPLSLRQPGAAALRLCETWRCTTGL